MFEINCLNFFVLMVWIFFNCSFVILNCLVFFMQARGQTWLGRGPEGLGPEGWRIRVFFFCLSLGVFSWNFGARRGFQCPRLEHARGSRRRRGFTRQHQSAIPRKDPKEREVRKKIVAGEGKKSEILGGPVEGSLGEGGSGMGPRRVGPRVLGSGLQGASLQVFWF